MCRQFVGGKGMTWRQTEDVFYQHFNAEVKQTEISNELSSTRISNIRSKTNSDRQAVDKIISRISALAPLAKNRDRFT